MIPAHAKQNKHFRRHIFLSPKITTNGLIFGQSHPPLNQAGIIIAPRAHYLEHPPRIIGFEGILHACASC